MRTIITKIPAIIGLILNILGLCLFISLQNTDRGTGLALLSLCFLMAVGSLILYFVDAILSIIRAIKKINPAFNITLALLIVIPVVLLICFKPICTGLVIAYYSIIFLFEVISTFMHIKNINGSKN